MIIYIVQPGDTLNMIARRFNVTSRAIIESNPIRNDLVIFPGQFLFIPREDNDGCYYGNMDPFPFPFPPSTPELRRIAFYEVQRGDTLQTIARRFDTTVEAIVQANGLEGANATIYPGQVLRIPVGRTGMFAVTEE